jgi:hypothetical protein
LYHIAASRMQGPNCEKSSARAYFVEKLKSLRFLGFQDSAWRNAAAEGCARAPRRAHFSKA